MLKYIYCIAVLLFVASTQGSVDSIPKFSNSSQLLNLVVNKRKLYVVENLLSIGTNLLFLPLCP